MATQLAIILRKIRDEADDSMRGMAKKLNLSVSYLSAIENCKRNVPKDFELKVINVYDLSEEEKRDLKLAIESSASKLKIDVKDMTEQKKKLLLALTKDELSDETIEKLCTVLEKEGGTRK